MVSALLTALFLFVAPQAIADVDGTKTANSGTTDASAGGHGTLTVGGDFTYSDADEDLKRVVVDFPAGGVGNPNAVPYADRCTGAQFETGVCPAASQIGVVKLAATAMLGVTPIPLDLEGTISIIQTTPEVPTIVGAYIVPPIGDPIRSYAQFYPVTSGPDGDFRVRSVTSDFPRVAHTSLGDLPIQIDKYEQVLWGVLPSGVPFITNPTRCDTWMSYAYVEAWDSNTNADSDPLMTGTNTFKRIEPVPTAPNCSNLPPLNTTVTAKLNSPIREDNPQLSVVVTNPTAPGTDLPRNMVVTLPGSIAADIDAIAVDKLCTVVQRNAGACPAASKVGTVNIATPMIVAGLRGDVHLIRKDEGGLPNLAIFVTGAINFRLDATTRYVGAKGTQIETTLVDLPQAPFTRFELAIAGGRPDGLLVFRECPTDGSSPEDGPIIAVTTGYTGRTVVNNSPVANHGCYGTPEVSRLRRCVKYKLKFTPKNLVNKAGIMKVEVYIKGRYGKRKRYKIYRKSPFKITQPLSKRRFTGGRNYKYKVRVVYEPTIDKPESEVLVSKHKKFKKC